MNQTIKNLKNQLFDYRITIYKIILHLLLQMGNLSVSQRQEALLTWQTQERMELWDELQAQKQLEKQQHMFVTLQKKHMEELKNVETIHKRIIVLQNNLLPSSKLPQSIIQLCLAYLPKEQIIYYSYNWILFPRHNVCNIAILYKWLDLHEWARDNNCPEASRSRHRDIFKSTYNRQSYLIKL